VVGTHDCVTTNGMQTVKITHTVKVTRG